AAARPIRALVEQAACTASPRRPFTSALAACLLAVGAGIAVLAGPTKDPVPRQAKESPAAPAKREPAVAMAQAEPPLPRGVLARIGSSRLRHTSQVASIAFSADGRWIASPDGNGTACVWDAATGTLRARFTGGK